MKRAVAMVLGLLLLLVCGRNPRPSGANRHVAAANRLTGDYEASGLSRWSFRAYAAGGDCAVLIVETPMVLREPLVDAIHYGAGRYGVYRRGVHGFARDHEFRGTAYKDRSGKIWTYGDVTDLEAAVLKRCR